MSTMTKSLYSSGTSPFDGPSDAAPEPTFAIPFIWSPTNWILVLVTLYLAYIRFRPAQQSPVPSKVASEDAIVFEYYTPKELAKYNGVEEKRILMGIKGRVYDVTSGGQFYGPNGPYGNFAGRDASRGLSKGSFDIDMITPLDQPMDPLDDLSSEESKALDDWEEHFKTKYILCGALVEEGQKPSEEVKA